MLLLWQFYLDNQHNKATTRTILPNHSKHILLPTPTGISESTKIHSFYLNLVSLKYILIALWDGKLISSEMDVTALQEPSATQELEYWLIISGWQKDNFQILFSSLTAFIAGSLWHHRLRITIAYNRTTLFEIVPQILCSCIIYLSLFSLSLSRKCKNIYKTLVRAGDREAICMWEEGVYGNSVLSARFCYELKITKKGLFFKTM